MPLVLILESNQNHAQIIDNEICPTLPAAMGMGGGYVPMVVIDDSNAEKILQRDNNGNRNLSDP